MRKEQDDGNWRNISETVCMGRDIIPGRDHNRGRYTAAAYAIDIVSINKPVEIVAEKRGCKLTAI